VVEKLGAVNLRIQKSVRANTMIVHVDKVKHCTGVTHLSWLGKDDYNVVPPVLEADTLPTMFGDMDQNAPNSSDDETRINVIKDQNGMQRYRLATYAKYTVPNRSTRL